MTSFEALEMPSLYMGFLVINMFVFLGFYEVGHGYSIQLELLVLGRKP